MAKKERNKRSARKARQLERDESQATQSSTQPKKTEAKKNNDKPGFFGKIAAYFSGVRSELRRSIWPGKEELKNYSLGVITMLLVFGVVIWLVDNAVVMCLTAFASLRG